jgi:SAM-dependent methyltransferase
LLTVEWHPAGQYQLGPEDADVLIQVRGGDLMWQKERLLNLGFARLPAAVEYVAWLDCEVLFDDPRWPERTTRALQEYRAVQPFSHVWYTSAGQAREIAEAPHRPDRRWSRYRVGSGVIASAKLLHQQGREALVDADLRGHLNPDLANDGSQLARIPGLAWAVRRSTLADLALFDRAIIGAGDWLWMLGILGSSQRWLAEASRLGYSYLDSSSYSKWAEAAWARFGGSVGYVEAPLLHLYHGPLGNRGYKARHRSFSRLGIDIETDITTTAEGPWQFVDARPEWTEFMHTYFRERREDDGLDPPVEPRLDERPLRDLLSGVYAMPAILVAHELGLFPLLATQPRTVAEVGQALGLRRRPAEALLAVCAAAGLVSAQAGRHALLPLAERFFLPESPAYFGGYWDLMIQNAGLYTFESIRQAVLTDAPQVERISGLAPSPESKAQRLRALTRALHSRGADSAMTWPGRVDLAGHRVFLDLGGGSGVHSIGVLQRWPHLRAIVFDLPSVCALAAEQVAQRGLEARIHTQAGDLWDPAPFPFADIHFYSEVFHNRAPEQCVRLLAKSFRDLPPGGRLLLHEMLFDDGLAGPLPVAAANLNMLLWSREGRQYSVPDLTGMVSAAGFLEVRLLPAGGYFSLLSARKPHSARTPSPEEPPM